MEHGQSDECLERRHQRRPDTSSLTIQIRKGKDDSTPLEGELRSRVAVTGAWITTVAIDGLQLPMESAIAETTSPRIEARDFSESRFPTRFPCGSRLLPSMRSTSQRSKPSQCRYCRESKSVTLVRVSFLFVHVSCVRMTLEHDLRLSTREAMVSSLLSEVVAVDSILFWIVTLATTALPERQLVRVVHFRFQFYYRLGDLLLFFGSGHSRASRSCQTRCDDIEGCERSEAHLHARSISKSTKEVLIDLCS